MRVLLLALAPLVALIGTSSSALAVLLFGPGYGASGPALARLTVAASCYGWLALVVAVAAAFDRPGLRLALVASFVPVAVAVVWPMTRAHGPGGAALAALAVHAAAALTATAVAWRALGVRPPLASAARALVAAAAVGAAGLAWPAAGTALVGKLALLALAYLLGLVLLGEVRGDDLRQLRAALGRSR
jgi:O-antigen/teichoic acid export membrane protein